MHAYVYCSINYSQYLEAAQSPSVEEWTKKVLYMCSYSDIKRKEISPFATVWVDLESIILSEISQLQKDKYHRISLIHGTNEQKKLMNKIDTDNILIDARGDRFRGLGIKQINKRELIDTDNSMLIMSRKGR